VFDEHMKMPSPDGNAGLELHDSEVERIEEEGADLILTLAAYVHRTPGTPGVASGSGWSQGAVLHFARATIQTGFGTLPTVLWDGTLTAGSRVIENVIPVPASFPGPVRIELVAVSGEVMVVDAESLESTLVGEPTYVEEFRGSPLGDE
jgi:hypothetical protein